MAQKRQTPRERYAARVHEAAFGSGVRRLTPKIISEITGIPYATVRGWNADAGKMPAWQYIRIMDAIKANGGAR